jgi:hypothetical protein
MSCDDCALLILLSPNEQLRIITEGFALDAQSNPPRIEYLEEAC